MATPTFYEPEVLAHLQKLEMSILKDFDAICRKYHLTYWGFCGTGIGALRHQGFIPWDDDIDISMPRRDFNRFCKILEREMGDKYYLLNAAHNINYPLSNTRLCLRGTEFREYALKDVDCPWGIFIDIYPLDNAADDPIRFYTQMWSSWFWGKMMILRAVPRPYLYIDGWLAKMVTAACVATHHGMKVLGISKEWLYRKRETALRKYNKKKTRRMTFFCDPKPYTNTFDRAKTYPLRYFRFEDVDMPFPNNVEELLTKMFGDYMTMPPVEKRKTHYPYKLDFGPYPMEKKE